MVEMRLCPGCNRTLRITAFRKRRGNRAGERHFKCRQCQGCDVTYDPHRHWKNQLKSRYGLTPADYERLLAKQRGKCAICSCAFSFENQYVKPHIDHDHNDGAVRGLLCQNCNRGLGMFKDNPELLELASSYLKGAKWAS